MTQKAVAVVVPTEANGTLPPGEEEETPGRGNNRPTSPINSSVTRPLHQVATFHLIEVEAGSTLEHHHLTTDCHHPGTKDSTQKAQTVTDPTDHSFGEF